MIGNTNIPQKVSVTRPILQKKTYLVDVEKSVVFAKRGAIRIVLSNTVMCRSDDPRIGEIIENGSYLKSAVTSQPDMIGVYDFNDDCIQL